MTIGEKIRLYREIRGMTQVQLANMTEINVGTIRKYELGIRNPKPEQLIKIAGGLGKNVSTFYDLNICAAGDIMTLLIAISEKAEISFVGDRDEEGYYKANEVALQFTDPYMQELMRDWATFRSELQYRLEKIDLEADEVEKAAKMRAISILYNGYMRVLTDKGRVSGENEPLLEKPSNKGLKDCMPFDRMQFIKSTVEFEKVDDED